MGRSTMIRIMVIHLLFSHLSCLTTASFLPPALLARQTSNCPSSYTRCADTKLPSNFCCPASTTCISLDDSSSAICCPQGSNCGFIEPLTCDVQAQNATANPSAFLKTTKLTDSLPTCGDLCCPFGYTCKGNNTCSLDQATSSEATASVASGQSTVTLASQTSATSATSQVTASASSASATTSTTPGSSFPSSAFASSPTTTALASAPPVLGSSANLEETCPEFPAKAIVAGFFPGLISGVLAALIVMMCSRRKQRKRESQMLSSLHPRSSNGTIIGISEPILSDTQSTFRTDFLLRKSDSQYAESTRSKSMLRRTGTRVRSLFGASPKPVPQTDASAPPPVPSIPPQIQALEKEAPSTPSRQQQLRRQPSTESIQIYSPASVLANAGIMQRPPLNKSTTTLHAVMNGNLQPGLNIHSGPSSDGNNGNSNLRTGQLPGGVSIQTVPSNRPNTTFNDIIERVGFQTQNGEPYYRVTETPTPRPGQGPSPRRDR